jgi:hypothetical protein
LSSAISNFGLIGNWSGDFSGGDRPSSWNGSVKILQQAFDSKKPVKFGQCWVFSGVTTACCRALGIPARSVTCFDSAHDTDVTMTIDKYITKDNDHVDGLESDSIWNAHVGKEVWMKRPDIAGRKNKVNYDGWQVIDATPQEESFGRMQCGPAPVRALHLGILDAGFEAGFVFGEVNADVCYWLVSEDVLSNRPRIERLAYQDHDNCGASISTKAVGSMDRNDLTQHYKYPEGSDAEREAFNMAYPLGEGSGKFGDEIKTSNSPKVSLAVEDDLEVGEDITISFNIESVDVDRNITYNGGLYTCTSADKAERKDLVIRHTGDGKTVKVSKGKPLKVSNEVKATDYFSKLANGNCMMYSLVVQDMDSNVCCMKDFKFVLAPKQVMQLGLSTTGSADKIKINDQLTFQVNVKNPFECTMTNCILSFEGQNMGNKSESFGDLPAGESKSIEVTLVPKKTGIKTLLFDFFFFLFFFFRILQTLSQPPEGAIFRLGLNIVTDENQIPLKYAVILGAPA